MNTKTLLQNFEVLSIAPGAISKLRELILNLAVTGKLSHNSDSWTLRTLGEIANIRTGKLDANASSPDGKYPFFTCAKDPLKISSFSYDTECVLLAGNGNFDVNYYFGKFDAYQRTYIIEAKNQDEVYIPYLFRFMQGHSKKLLEQSIGGVIKYIKIGFLTDAPLRLPTFSEQKRIVAKVDELMALCDQLEQQEKHRDNLRTATRKSAIDAISTATTPEELEAAWNRISRNWEVIADTPESVSSLRELVLDLAIRGKLVRQDLKSDSVVDLIQEMAVQKERDEEELGRRGKGSNFPKKNTLHNLPTSWHKCHLGDIALIVMGNSPPGDSYRDSEEGVPLINGPVEFSKPQLGPTVRSKFTISPTYMCKEKDLLVCVRGATTGRTNVSAFDACIGRGVALVRGWQSQEFMNLFMWNVGSELLAKGKGTTFPSISFDDIAGLEIGLPPKEEQELIVKRVDELMALCDQLETDLKIRSDLAEKFARSVVSAA
jgi:type I restriction enzyme S subunit